MIVTCDTCGLKYKVDPSKIKGDQARLTCKGCSNVIVVNKPEETDYSSSQEMGEHTFETSEDSSTRSLYDPAATERTEVKVTPETKRSGISLTAKVIMLMLLVSLLPGIAYFAITFNQTNQRITEETSRSGRQITGILTDEINQWVDKNVRVLEAVAKMPGMQSMDRATQDVLLRAVQKQYPWMYLVFTTDPKGMNIARSDSEGLKNYSDRQYVKDVKDGKSLAWENLIGKTSHEPALVLAVPIKKDGQLVGVLASAMTLDEITKIVTSWQQGQSGFVFIVDQNGKVVAHPNKKFVQEQKNLSRNPLVLAAKDKVMKMIEFKDADGQEAIGFSRKTDLGWTLALQENKSEAFSALQKAQTTALLLFGGTVVCILIISLFASRAIVNPIRKLTDAANRISVGELSVEIVKSSQDEIGDLADAITRMQDSIRLSIERLRRKKR